MIYHIHFRAFSTLPIILSAISHFHCRSYFSSPTTSRAVTRSLQGAKRKIWFSFSTEKNNY